MNKSHQQSTWLIYERCVAAFTAQENSDLNVTVQPNVKLTGHFSGAERQIDVLIDSRWKDQVDRRVIIDAKERKRKIDVKDVETFEGMMRDCQANRGIIVCTSGYTEAAYKRAQQAITITVLTLEDLEEYEWVYEPCMGNCLRKQNNQGNQGRGMVLWAAYMGIPINNLMLILQTGKCDGCHSFHIWCWDCGLKFAVADRTIVRCTCGYEWISYPEQDDKNNELSMLLMFRVDEEYGAIIDRRPIQ